jgi:hypothetical protein
MWIARLPIWKLRLSRVTSNSTEHARLLSQPIPVEWAGWETTTLDLQHAGWRLAIEFDLERIRYRLLMKHEVMKLEAVTYAEELHVHDPYQRNYRLEVERLGRFRVQHVGSIQVVRIVDNFSRFQEIDARPVMTMERPQSIADLNIFNTKRSVEQVFVDKADMSVIEHLQAIKDLQSPKQRELRDRNVKQSTENAGELVAQLIHLAA